MRFDKERLARLLEKKILVVYHRDVDGTTAAAQLLKVYPGDALSLDAPLLDAVTVHEIIERKAEVVVFLDLAVDRDLDKIREIEKTSEVVIIDHHLFENNPSSSKTMYMNPRLQKSKAYEPTSYGIHRVLETLGKPTVAWIAAIGVIGDYGFEECKDIFDEVASELVQGDPLQSRLGQGAKLISSAITVADEVGAEKALHALLKAGSFEAFEAHEQLQTWKKEVQQEIQRVVESFQEKAELHPSKGLGILEVTSKLSINSTVSTILAEQNPEMTIITYRQVDDGYKLSLRNQSGSINLNTILKNVCKGIGRGGGHEKAAGALITDWETFKKRFLEAL